VAIAQFLREIGVIPVVCASGGKSGFLKKRIKEAIPDMEDMDILIRDGIDFMDISDEAARLNPDFLIGSSKGYSISRKLNIPLVRIGFPIHDRFGGQRLHHIGYKGTQELFDRIANTIIESRQSTSPVGYTYM